MNTEILNASERLALSRQRLRQAMMGPAPAAGRGEGRPIAWLDELKAVPGADILIALAQNWWSRHPMRAVAQVAMDAVGSLVRPWARQHPLGLVMGATAIGGLLAWGRPWRWISSSALLAGVLPQLLAAYQSTVNKPRSS